MTPSAANSCLLIYSCKICLLYDQFPFFLHSLGYENFELVINVKFTFCALSKSRIIFIKRQLAICKRQCVCQSRFPGTLVLPLFASTGLKYESPDLIFRKCPRRATKSKASTRRVCQLLAHAPSRLNMVCYDASLITKQKYKHTHETNKVRDILARFVFLI